MLSNLFEQWLNKAPVTQFMPWDHIRCCAELSYRLLYFEFIVHRNKADFEAIFSLVHSSNIKILDFVECSIVTILATILIHVKQVLKELHSLVLCRVVYLVKLLWLKVEYLKLALNFNRNTQVYLALKH